MAAEARRREARGSVLAHFLLFTSAGSLVLVLAVSTVVAVGFWMVVSVMASLVGRAVWWLSSGRRPHPR
jgi:hypothetical protein